MGKVAHGDFTVSGFAGRDSETTISNDGGGDTQCRGRVDERVPCNLGIVMGVAVNDAWHECQTLRIDGLFGFHVQRGADLVDKPVMYGDI